jgi:hypothetical protein
MALHQTLQSLFDVFDRLCQGECGDLIERAEPSQRDLAQHKLDMLLAHLVEDRGMA